MVNASLDWKWVKLHFFFRKQDFSEGFVVFQHSPNALWHIKEQHKKIVDNAQVSYLCTFNVFVPFFNTASINTLQFCEMLEILPLNLLVISSWVLSKGMKGWWGMRTWRKSKLRDIKRNFWEKMYYRLHKAPTVTIHYRCTILEAKKKKKKN